MGDGAERWPRPASNYLFLLMIVAIIGHSLTLVQ